MTNYFFFSHKLQIIIMLFLLLGLPSVLADPSTPSSCDTLCLITSCPAPGQRLECANTCPAPTVSSKESPLSVTTNSYGAMYGLVLGGGEANSWYQAYLWISPFASTLASEAVGFSRILSPIIPAMDYVSVPNNVDGSTAKPNALLVQEKLKIAGEILVKECDKKPLFVLGINDHGGSGLASGISYSELLLWIAEYFPSCATVEIVNSACKGGNIMEGWKQAKQSRQLSKQKELFAQWVLTHPEENKNDEERSKAHQEAWTQAIAMTNDDNLPRISVAYAADGNTDNVQGLVLKEAKGYSFLHSWAEAFVYMYNLENKMTDSLLGGVFAHGSYNGIPCFQGQKRERILWREQ